MLTDTIVTLWTGWALERHIAEEKLMANALEKGPSASSQLQRRDAGVDCTA